MVDSPQTKGFSIAIDGPVASGKGTLALALAKRLDGFFLNTGAMYRSLALLAFEKGVDFNDEEEVLKLLPLVNVDLRDGKVFLNGKDVTDEIKKPEPDKGSSIVAVYKKVREVMVSKQQELANKNIEMGKIVIGEGRDAGTRVLPNASLKIYLTADIQIRAKRRQELYKSKGVIKTFEEVLEEAKIRDERDSQREIDPLPSDPEKLGYWILDNSMQTEEESINVIMDELKRRGLLNDKN